MPGTYFVTVTVYDDGNEIVDTTTFEVIISSESSIKSFQEGDNTQSEQEQKTTFIFIIICFGGSLVVILAVFWKNIKPIFSLHSNKKHMKENNKK